VTKKETLNKLYELYKKSKYKEYIKTSEVIKLIEKIYKDEEEKICKNCSKVRFWEGKIGTDCEILVQGTFGQIYSLVNSGFGCNKFERRQNEDSKNTYN